MDDGTEIDLAPFVGAGDGGTTEQLRYFTNAVINDTPIAAPAANLDEAMKTMLVAEGTLAKSPDVELSVQQVHRHSQPQLGFKGDYMRERLRVVAG